MKKAGEREKRVAKLSTLDAKLLSFSYSASGVSWNRFCNMWLLKSGFSPREVGLMKSLSLVGKFVAQPVWAGTATARRRAVLAQRPSRRPCSRSRVCAWARATATTPTPSRRRRAARCGAHQALGPPRAPVLRSMAPAASPVADSMVLALAREGGEAWGRQRFWGSASWGLGSVVVGALIDRVGLEAGLFGVSYVVSFALLLVLLARLRPAWPRKKPVPDDAGACCGEGDAFESASDADDAPAPAAETKKRAPRNLGAVCSRGLVALRRSPPLRLALANGVVFGTGVVVVDSILYMQLESELGVSRTVNGLATAAATASTFPFFWHSAELLGAYGHWRVLFAAQCLLPIRLLLHACVTADNFTWLLLPVQCLHGPMFAAWLSAAVELVDALAPPELRASSQSLLTMAYFTVGGAVGHLVWSAIFEARGGVATYLLAAAFSAVATAVFALAAAPSCATSAAPPSRGRPRKDSTQP
ncbi:hypothetical protein JL721_7162 [Aureococcus anophagefferens]|nr:hypothetical protein JL721_7162 [Aureococcus anophagefferens]